MKNYDKKDIICTTDNGITVVCDINHARTLASQYHQGCFAMKDANMGYGIWFAKNGIAGNYEPKETRVFIDKYWDANIREIDRALNDAWNTNDLNALIEVGAEIIIDCSTKMIETFEEFKQHAGA